MSHNDGRSLAAPSQRRDAGTLVGLGRARHRSLLWVCLLTGAMASNADAQQPPPPPAPPWKDFVKVEGHDIEIPSEWVATAEGKFAHGIRLPDSVPRTVPFDFRAAWWKALWPKEPPVAQQYWEHLCATEAGSFILKPVKNVDGFFFMRPVRGASEQQKNDRWRLEAPGMEGKWGFRYDPEVRAIGFVNPPWGTYQWVHFPSVDGRAVLHMFGFVDRVSPMTVETRPQSDARYGLTWRGIHRARDREHLISGLEWIVLDRQSNEVLAVFRDFYRTGGTVNQREGIYWQNAPSCPFRKQLFGRQDVLTDVQTWLPMALQPKIYPKVLELVDHRTQGDNK